MSVKWQNIIKDMSKGMDGAAAFNKEQKRVRDQNRRQHEENVRRQNERREAALRRREEN